MEAFGDLNRIRIINKIFLQKGIQMEFDWDILLILV